MAGEDRRDAVRRNIRIPIETTELGAGTTVDVSATGVAFEIDRSLVPEQPHMIQFALSGSGVTLRCEGRVVRSEDRGEQVLLAVTIDSMEVHPNPARVSVQRDRADAGSQ